MSNVPLGGQMQRGCRATAYNDGGSYFAVDPNTCHFFKGGWYDRFAEVARLGEELLAWTETDAPDSNR